MTDWQLAPEIVDFYTSTIDESARLRDTADGRLELVRTQELLRRHLPSPPARVLDVGGGPGAHARWLTDDGYDVDIVDAVERHVSEARADGLVAELGDARSLAAPDASYDIVLLLGPLYHLLEPVDRLAALREARRVLPTDGMLAASAINRYASLFENTANTMLAREPVRRAIAGILATGKLEKPRGFTTAYFHRPGDLVAEVAEAGFADPVVYSVEGPAWGLLKAAECHTGESLIDSPMFESALAVARMTEGQPELMAAASHLLAVARAV